MKHNPSDIGKNNAAARSLVPPIWANLGLLLISGLKHPFLSVSEIVVVCTLFAHMPKVPDISWVFSPQIARLTSCLFKF